MRLIVSVLAAALLLVGGPAVVRADTPDELLAAASALIDARKPADAAVKLEAFLSAAPKHAKAGPAALALGRCYSELDQHPKAVAAYEKAIATKDATVVTTAQLGLGESAMEAKLYDKAAAALEAALKAQLKPEQAATAGYWLGQARYELKKYAESEQAFVKVTTDFPRSEIVDGAFYGAGLAALKQNNSDTARQRFKTVVDRFPQSPDRTQAMLLLAQIDLDGKRYAEARSGFQNLLNDPKSKSDADAVQAAEEGLVSALLELKEYGGAAERLQSLLTRLQANDPQRFRAQLSLGHARYRQTQFDPAAAAYREAAKSQDADVAAEALYWAGNAALGLKKPAEAAAAFQAVVAKYPKHALAPKAQLRAGDAYAAAKQPDEAGTAYKAVVNSYPQSPEAAEARKALGELVDAVSDPAQLAAALKNASPADRARGTVRLARLYLQAKKPVEAAAALQESLKTNPEPSVASESQYLLGVALEALDKTAPALEALAAAVKSGGSAPWVGDAQGRLAWLYLDRNDAANAEKSALAALSSKPMIEAERNARLALVQALLDQEKWDPALEQSRVLLQGNPPVETIATVLFTQAWVHEKRMKPDEALPLWEKLLADHPKSQYTDQALLHIGDARFKAEKLDDAKTQYLALVNGFATSPLVPEARFKLGSTLYNLEKHADAVAEWEKVAADKNAGDYIPEALYWAGVGYEKIGKKPEAIARLMKLVTTYPKSARVANAKVRLAALKAVTQ